MDRADEIMFEDYVSRVVDKIVEAVDKAAEVADLGAGKTSTSLLSSYISDMVSFELRVTECKAKGIPVPDRLMKKSLATKRRLREYLFENECHVHNDD